MRTIFFQQSRHVNLVERYWRKLFKFLATKIGTCSGSVSLNKQIISPIIFRVFPWCFRVFCRLFTDSKSSDFTTSISFSLNALSHICVRLCSSLTYNLFWTKAKASHITMYIAIRTLYYFRHIHFSLQG